MNTLRNLMLAGALTLVAATTSFAQPYVDDPEPTPGYRSYDYCGPPQYDSSGAPIPNLCD
jgi:hypothetical protein